MNSATYAERIELMLGEPAGIAENSESRSSLANPDQFLMEYFNGGGPVRAGVMVNQATALSASSVFACVRNLAEDVAKLPLIVGRQTPEGGVETLAGHPLYRLLDVEPNPEMTAFDFRQALIACAAFLGNFIAEIERANDGTPKALWPIENYRWKLKRGPDKQLYYEIDGGRSRLAPADVLHVKGFGMNGVLGEMLLQCGRESIGLMIAAERFAASFFGNGTQMSGVLKTTKVLKDPAIETLRRQWMEMHSGPDNAHKPAILEDGMDWVKTSAEPNEAQMIETRMFQVEDVARWFRMPPHKIGHLERAQGWSTLESANTDYVVDTLMPWTIRCEQEYKRKLVGKSEPAVFAAHLFNGLLRGDATARAAYYMAMRNAGILNADDIRKLENLNPLPDGLGQVYLVPANMMNAKKAAAMDGSANDPSMKTAPVAAPAVSADPAMPPGGKDQITAEARNALSLNIADAHRSIFMDAAERVVRRAAGVLGKGEMKREASERFWNEQLDYAQKAFAPAIAALQGTRRAAGLDALEIEPISFDAERRSMPDLKTWGEQWPTIQVARFLNTGEHHD